MGTVAGTVSTAFNRIHLHLSRRTSDVRHQGRAGLAIDRRARRIGERQRERLEPLQAAGRRVEGERLRHRVERNVRAITTTIAGESGGGFVYGFCVGGGVEEVVDWCLLLVCSYFGFVCKSHARTQK